MLWLSGRRRERQIAEALAASLDAVRGGTATVEDCLRRYPALAAELEPLLRTAATVQVLSRVSPREEARLEGRAALLQAAAKRSQPAAIIPRPVVRRRPWVAFVPAAIAAALFAAIAIPVLGSMDTGSTPGDWNYGFKRATERIRLAITTDPGERRLLRLEFASRRLDEIERLKATGHVASQRSDLIAVIHDYQADLAQAAVSAQTAGALPPAQKDQFATVTNKATDVLTQVQQSVPASDPVNTAAQDAKDETTTTATAVKAVPTTTPSARGASSQPSATLAPTSAAVSTGSATPATVVATPPPTPPAGTGTPAGTSTPAGSATPPATGTTTGTSTAVSGSPTAVATASAVPTREAPTLPAVLSSPASTPASTPARTPSPPPAETSTPAPEPTALAAIPTRTPLPAALAPAIGSPAPTPAAEPTPGRTATPSAPTAVGTRPSTILPPVTGSTALVTGSNVFKYAGAPASLDQITASLGGQLVVVWYVNAQQTSSSWYPGTPAPSIGPGAILTIVTRGPAVLAAPGTLLSSGR